MSARVGFLGLGANGPEARAHLEQALVGLETAGVRIAAVAAPVSGPFVGPQGRPDARAPRVLNSVAEVRATLTSEALLACCARLEEAAGRVRDGSPLRTLDLDLLMLGEEVRECGAPQLPHPRALERAFVLAPWEEIAPFTAVPGTGSDVLTHAARLRARAPEAFAALTLEAPLALPDLRGRLEVLPDRAALALWRSTRTGALGLVPTMGALHAGHAALVRRARAESETVLASVFVNPLQFGAGEDLGRYPRTFESDRAVLAAAGADAVYVPDVADLYPAGFATYVAPEGPALAFEGERRPGHFRGVATVVLKLFQRARAQRAWFGRKDAQQAAVIERLVRDLDLLTEVVVAPTVRDHDGLALSSRNRYLTPEERTRALALPRALERLRQEAASGEREVARLLALTHARLDEAGLAIDYLSVVEPRSFEPLERLGSEPALALATVRCGTTRLLDNRWVVGGR